MRAHRARYVARSLALVALLSQQLPCEADAQVPDAAASIALEHGWTDLASGRPREARDIFERGLVTWGRYSPSSSGYIDSERGLVLAYLFNREDASAARYFAKVLTSAGPEPEADRLLFAGHFSEAIRSYRDSTEDNAVVDPIPGPDRIIAAGAHLALNADLRGAIREWNLPAVGRGPNDLTDVQLALIGIAYARQNDWRNAQRSWLIAARTERLEPQMSAFATGNVIALSMLIHYRAHFARGEGRYRWPQLSS